jgi:hypothetical protein
LGRQAVIDESKQRKKKILLRWNIRAYLTCRLLGDSVCADSIGASITSRKRLNYRETAFSASGVFFTGCAGDPVSAASCRRNTGKAKSGKTPITPTVIMSLPKFE